MAEYKAVLLGASGVGKTSIATRWHENKFSESVAPTSRAATFRKTFKQGMSIVFCDTAGHDKYHAIAPMHYKDANLVMLVFAVNDEVSCRAAADWYPEVVEIVTRKVPFVLVANKIDLESKRIVPAHAGMSFARRICAEYFEVSAASGVGLDHLFRTLPDLLTGGPRSTVPRKSMGKKTPLLVTPGMDELTEDTPKKRCCC
jgi:small GTP-binding protein